MTRRTALGTLTAGVVGSLGGTLPRLEAVEHDDFITTQVTSEISRAAQELQRTHVVRSESLRTVAANLRLMAHHSNQNLHLDQKLRKSLSRSSTAIQPMDHERMRGELQRFGFNTSVFDDAIRLHTPVDQQAIRAATTAFASGARTLVGDLNTVADNLEHLATIKVRQEAAAVLSNHGRVVLVGQSIDTYCSTICMCKRMIETSAAIACAIIIIPEACAAFTAALLYYELMAWMDGCGC